MLHRRILNILIHLKTPFFTKLTTKLTYKFVFEIYIKLLQIKFTFNIFMAFQNLILTVNRKVNRSLQYTLKIFLFHFSLQSYNVLYCVSISNGRPCRHLLPLYHKQYNKNFSK